MMNPSSQAPAVSHDMQMQVVLDDGNRVALSATLHYDAHDPFAVSATFRTGEGDITWVFARDLLRDGLYDMAGEGDIVIRPGHPSRGPVVSITLSSPSGAARIEGSRTALAAFVEEIYDVVPEGSEWVYLDMETTIGELLSAEGGEPYTA
jgi:Streptomyces sporulation and cell division protein, SsgA